MNVFAAIAGGFIVVAGVGSIIVDRIAKRRAAEQHRWFVMPGH